MQKYISAFAITSFLWFGSQGIQVKNLQHILNISPDTRVAVSGPGSPGQETTFFGPGTQKAVIAFQNKFGIPKTGFVGPLTLKKLNELTSDENTALMSGNSSISSIAVAPYEKTDIYATDNKINALQSQILASINSALSAKTTPQLPQVSSATLPQVYIQNISSQQALPGTEITISSTGLSSKNSLYIGPNYIIRDLKPSLTKTITFQVPSIPSGRYDIAIRNEDGISNTVVLVVKSKDSPMVQITSVSPSDVTYGETITITGSGFCAYHNEIVTDIMKIKDVSSPDGKTLSATISPESLKELVKLGTAHKKYPIYVNVICDNGITDQPGMFNLVL